MIDEEKQKNIDIILNLVMKGVKHISLEAMYGKEMVDRVVGSKEYSIQLAQAEIKKAEKKAAIEQARFDNKLLAVKRQRDILQKCNEKDANLANQINNLSSREVEYEKAEGKLDAQEGRLDAVDGEFKFNYKLSNEA